MQKHAEYVPLHVHTEYSLLDGAIKIAELAETARAWRLPAVAMTDHGNLFGAIDFYKQVTKADLKPIIGAELYVAPKSRLDRKREEENAFHLVALARDNHGYRNLVNLVSRAYTEGFYYRPRVDRELLEKYREGLLVLTSCMKGEVPFYLSRGMKDKARETALYYRDLLGPDNYYIELQENGIPEQAALNRELYGLARELEIKVAGTNDCHYLKKEDARAHDILLCIQTGKTVNDPGRLRFSGDGLYFRSPDEMAAAFREIPEALRNTLEIAGRCNVEFKLEGCHLPSFSPPGGVQPGKFLEELALKGLKDRLGGAVPSAYADRLNHELSVIRKMGFESYFLIVWDFVNYARGRSIPVGPGRGSAAGSLVAYALGITEIDPLKYGLLFERFLNPERVSLPDIDMDFCKDRRQEIINYVAEKYGHEHMAQIITFGTMGAKAVIRDVGRALAVPYQEVDRIAKLVPETLNITIDEAMAAEPRFRDACQEKDEIKELIAIARRLEGLSRHASTHAAGVVISPRPLTEIAPLYRNPSDGTITTQFDMVSIDSLGLVKFDFLGLKTLTAIQKTVDFIAGNGKGPVDLKNIPIDDAKTFELLRSGQNTGIFQLESSGMREIMVRMGPERFEDLIALNALYRPGPLGSGMIDKFINSKKGVEKTSYDLPQLKEILDETYGVILYQEQVMRIAHDIAGFSMGQADILRKAMGKKQPEVMEKQREAFVKGARARGVTEGKAKKLFELMAKFAEYGFNKSHSAAYALVAYQTAYLKAHYPVEFMAAMMSIDLDNTDKIVTFIKECLSMGIKVLPPDINHSEGEFRVAGDVIRFGLAAVKGVGLQAIEEMLAARAESPKGATAPPDKFASFEDFLSRMNGRKGARALNRKAIEALVKSGAFDGLGATRKQCIEKLELKDKGVSVNQQSMFGGLLGENTPVTGNGGGPMPAAADEFDEAERLRYEKEALGFYISGNPMSRYKPALARMHAKTTAELPGLPDKSEASLGGIIRTVKTKTTREKGIMAYITLDDGEGSAEAVIFPDLYSANAELLKKDTPVLVKGNVEASEKGARIIARQIVSVEESMRSGLNGKKMELSLAEGADLKKIMEYIKTYPEGGRGALPLKLSLSAAGLVVVLETPLRVPSDETFIQGLSSLSGGRSAVKFL